MSPVQSARRDSRSCVRDPSREAAVHPLNGKQVRSGGDKADLRYTAAGASGPLRRAPDIEIADQSGRAPTVTKCSARSMDTFHS